MSEKIEDPLILAIPRGGVPIAFEVALELKKEMRLLVTRKLRAPQNPELAIGAVAPDKTVYLNSELIKALGVKENTLKNEINFQVDKIKRRAKEYAQDTVPRVCGKNVLVVDDGLATGATVLVAVSMLKKLKAKKVFVAVPVSSTDAKQLLENTGAKVICLQTPPDFFSVGQFYQNFPQTSDNEVKKLLDENKKLKGCKHFKSSGC